MQHKRSHSAPFVHCPLGLYQLGEDVRVLDRDLREDFAVQFDVTLFERRHEFGVDRSVQTRGGVDTYLLQSAIVALLELATNVGVLAGLRRRRLGERNLGFASPHHALGTGEDVLAAFDAVGSALDSWHRIRSEA